MSPAAAPVSSSCARTRAPASSSPCSARTSSATSAPSRRSSSPAAPRVRLPPALSPAHPSDFLIVGSDSGRIVVLEYDPASNTFTKLHQETYGRSGARRIVPGQYIATDPKGRAVMIGAMEKSKLVYILNRVRARTPSAARR